MTCVLAVLTDAPPVAVVTTLSSYKWSYMFVSLNASPAVPMVPPMLTLASSVPVADCDCVVWTVAVSPSASAIDNVIAASSAGSAVARRSAFNRSNASDAVETGVATDFPQRDSLTD